MLVQLVGSRAPVGRVVIYRKNCCDREFLVTHLQDIVVSEEVVCRHGLDSIVEHF